MMDNRLDQDLYRENMRIAGIGSRIGAYLIDMLIITLIITILFTAEQKQLIITAQETITNSYSSTYAAAQLSVTPDNAAALEELRVALKQALDVLLLYIAICAGLQIVYNFILLYRYGATLGQIIMRIKVVDMHNFDRPKLHVCMKRSVVKCFLGTMLYVGFIVAFIDKHYRTLHDRMSNTIVVSV